MLRRILAVLCISLATSAAWADGLVDNPAGQAIRKGDAVRFLPYSELYR